MSLASFDTPARSYRQHGSSVKREREREGGVSTHDEQVKREGPPQRHPTPRCHANTRYKHMRNVSFVEIVPRLPFLCRVLSEQTCFQKKPWKRYG